MPILCGTVPPQVGYSARILYQELRASRGYTRGYETVKRGVAPWREVQLQAERARLRFETPPGQQSQIDWGQATVPFRAGPVVVHVFVLTFGVQPPRVLLRLCRCGLAQFLEAHERAFAHCGSHTREDLYDRPRTVGYAMSQGGGSGIPPSKRLPTIGASSRRCVGPIGRRPRARSNRASSM
jgi:transposase